MTDADLRAIAGALESERALWAERLTALVDRKLDEAKAHANLAVTETLRSIPDGRRTIRRAEKNRSYQAAVNRLGELWVRLTGPTKDSLNGEIRNAREGFYRKAFDLHRPHIPESIRISDSPSPTARNIDLMRGAALHGYDPGAEIGKQIRDAVHRLSAAVALSASRGADERSSADPLSAWHNQTRKAVSATVLSLLSDSVEHANTEAMADLVHPDFRSEG